jgi:creatinine amidohydrolase
MAKSRADVSRIPKHKFWHHLTGPDFEGLDPERTVAVLPVGAIEQHGPHLPVWVDAKINEGIVARAAELAPNDLGVLFLPPQPVGKSNEHLAFKGTLTLSAETLIRLWTEIGDSVARAGLRKLAIFNSHGGQPQIVDIVCRDLRVRHAMLAVSINSYALGTPAGMFPPDEMVYGIHAGSSETSQMMYLTPDLVKNEERQNFETLPQKLKGKFDTIVPGGRTTVAWQMQDLNPLGAAGNALDADATRGKMLIEHRAAKLVQALTEIASYPLAHLASRG